MMNKPNAVQFVKNGDNLLLAGLAAVALVFLIQTGDYRPAAAMFPRLVSIVVIGLCFYQLGENAWTFFGGKPLKTKKKATEESVPGMAWYWIFLSVLVYFGLIYVLGFVLSTALYLLAFPVLVGYRRWVTIAVVAVVMTLLVHFSFGSILHVPLPEGMVGSWLAR